MRDRYLKEVRTELKSKQQGELVPSRWKYRQRLNFLAPFTGTRNGISENFINNNGEDHSPPDLDSLAADSPMSSAPTRRTRAIAKAPATGEAAFASSSEWGTLGSTGKKRKAKETLASVDGMKKSVGRTQDEDELFLLSFVPTLKRLTAQKRCEAKMKIQQILYEAEFSLQQPSPKREPKK